MAELHFEVSGSGNVPLICTHGWGCDGDQFIELSRFFEGEFRIFRPDLPGHGRTPLAGFAPDFGPYADALVDFALKHKLERPVLLGHSMGGVLSLLAAASSRLQPRAVINLDGSLPAAEKTLAGQEMIRSWLDEPTFRNRLARLLREAFFLAHERDARCDAIIQSMCAAPEAVLRFLPEHVGELHPKKTLPRVGAPVLFVGAANPRFDPSGAAALIRNFQLEQIPNTGHFLHVYVPDRVAELVKVFLAAKMHRDV